MLQAEDWKHNLVSQVYSLGTDLCSLRDSNSFTAGEWKGSQFKSQADDYAHARTCEFLHKITPGVRVVSEEDPRGHHFLGEELYWLIDPIDGTRSYCEGFQGFAIQICLMANGRPTWSCVYAPAESRMYVAQTEGGAFVNGLRVSRSVPYARRCLVDNYPEPRGIASSVFQNLPATEYLESGSLGLKICKVADGQADIFVKDVEIKVWDIAPAELLLKEVGGYLTDLEGKPICYNQDVNLRNGLVATASKEVLDSVLSVVSEYLPEIN